MSRHSPGPARPAHTRPRPGPSPMCLNCFQPRPGPGPQYVGPGPARPGPARPGPRDYVEARPGPARGLRAGPGLDQKPGPRRALMTTNDGTDDDWHDNREDTDLTPRFKFFQHYVFQRGVIAVSVHARQSVTFRQSYVCDTRPTQERYRLAVTREHLPLYV